MRQFIPRFKMDNPFLHGIAIGLIIALMFPQASIARHDDSQAVSEVMYAVLAATNHQFACTLDTSKKPCSSNALMFTLDNGPEPSVGDFEATSDEGHFVNVSISKFIPLIGDLETPDGVTQEEIDAVYLQEVAAFEADFMAAANDDLNQFADENNLDPNTLELPSLPELLATFEEARSSIGIALVTIDGEGGTVFAKALMGRATVDGETTTSHLPVEELAFEELVEQEQTLEQHPYTIGGENGEPETEEAFWGNLACAARFGAFYLGLIVGIGTAIGCLAGIATPAGIISCGISYVVLCGAIDQLDQFATDCRNINWNNHPIARALFDIADAACIFS